jgi:hypothetical protein
MQAVINSSDNDVVIRQILSGVAVNEIDQAYVLDIIDSARLALESKIILLRIEQRIVRNSSDYIEFFRRLGQGGVRLTDDELVYSIIKFNYPAIRARMTDITAPHERGLEGGVGRLIGEVDLALGALRTSQALHGDKIQGERPTWRPNPSAVEKLDFSKADGAVSFFKALLPEVGQGDLIRILRSVRRILEYDKYTNTNGFPRMLLARFDRELIDVLILWGAKQIGNLEKWSEEADGVRAFVLYWLIFVKNPNKAQRSPHFSDDRESIGKRAIFA